MERGGSFGWLLFNVCARFVSAWQIVISASGYTGRYALSEKESFGQPNIFLT